MDAKTDEATNVYIKYLLSRISALEAEVLYYKTITDELSQSRAEQIATALHETD